MQLIRGLHNLRTRHRGSVATIGNFDGVHRGHQLVIARTILRARAAGALSTVISFEPTPAEYFGRGSVPVRLTSLREKCAAMLDTGVDQFVCLRFDAAFADLSPDEFVSGVLVDALGIRKLMVGDDFRYGKARAGDFRSLVKAGEEHGFEVRRTETFDLDGERVSSSGVRRALLDGRLQRARTLLGRPYGICGRVIKGKQLGRELGFPTANIGVRGRTHPLGGVFAVRVRGASDDGRPRDGVASLGHRPTVHGDHEMLEVHLFDFDAPLYGRMLQVDFLAKLRDEEKFSSLDTMKEQMIRDAAEARRLLNRYA